MSSCSAPLVFVFDTWGHVLSFHHCARRLALPTINPAIVLVLAISTLGQGEKHQHGGSQHTFELDGHGSTRVHTSASK